MNRRNWKKLLSLVLVAMLAFALTGCSGASDESGMQSTALNIVVAAKYVDDEMISGLKEEVAKIDAGMEIVVSGVTMSNPDTDPMGFMGGSTQLAGRIASHEVDILITDADTARRMGENGEGYLAINDTFTADEIETFAAGLACVAVVNDEGEITDQVSAPCGAVLSEHASLLTGHAGMQMFIVSNTAHTDAAKKVFAYLAAME